MVVLGFGRSEGARRAAQLIVGGRQGRRPAAEAKDGFMQVYFERRTKHKLFTINYKRFRNFIFVIRNFIFVRRNFLFVRRTFACVSRTFICVARNVFLLSRTGPWVERKSISGLSKFGCVDRNSAWSTRKGP
jgi:hypothetical protein